MIKVAKTHRGSGTFTTSKCHFRTLPPIKREAFWGLDSGKGSNKSANKQYKMLKKFGHLKVFTYFCNRIKVGLPAHRFIV